VGAQLSAQGRIGDHQKLPRLQAVARGAHHQEYPLPANTALFVLSLTEATGLTMQSPSQLTLTRVDPDQAGRYRFPLPALGSWFSVIVLSQSDVPTEIDFKKIDFRKIDSGMPVLSRRAYGSPLEPETPIVNLARAGSGSIAVTLSKTKNSTRSVCFYADTPGVNVASKSTEPFTGNTIKISGLDDNQTYFFACRSENPDRQGALSPEQSLKLVTPVEAFSLLGASTYYGRPSEMVTISPTFYGWTAADNTKIRIVMTPQTAGGQDVAAETLGASLQMTAQLLVTASNSAPMVINVKAYDRYYGQEVGSTSLTINALGTFTETSYFEKPSGAVCRIRTELAELVGGLDGGETHPLIRTITGGNTLFNLWPILRADAKTASGSTATGRAEINLPALNMELSTGDGVASGQYYLSYFWKPYAAAPTSKTAVAQAFGASGCNTSPTNPACWRWQPWAVGMERPRDAEKSCETCGSEIKPAWAATSVDDWRDTIAVTASMSAGNDHICFVEETGRVHCAGKNNFGQLGDGANTSRETLLPVRCPEDAVSGDCDSFGFFKRAVKVISLENTTCALTASFTAYCWGEQKGNTVWRADQNSTWHNNKPTRFTTASGTRYPTMPGTNFYDIGFTDDGRPVGVRTDGRIVGFSGTDIEDDITVANYASIWTTTSGEALDSMTIAKATGANAWVKMILSKDASFRLVQYLTPLSSTVKSSYQAKYSACRRIGMLKKP
jgi:hypothetical protein